MSPDRFLKKLFYQANQKWDNEADLEARKDSDKTLALYLSAPKIKSKLNKLRDDTKLFHFWQKHLNDMPGQK